LFRIKEIDVIELKKRIENNFSFTLLDVREPYEVEFAKIEPKAAKKMKQDLINKCGLTEEEAVEIINIQPKSLPELRSFTFGWKKLILSETLEKILKIIDDNP